MLNSKLIKQRMAQMGLTQKNLAEMLNLASPTVNQKINNSRPLTLQEAEKIAKILKIEDNLFGEYFFGG
ncbi:helix-turn-helix domain-containing protein [Eubacterium limosum]|uniref:helix-turn-helix domain-containing protein n=1 Tax=Eubacterium limosum TaxID=1736 RepID=UPI001D08D4E7|nr:helix-turn-helix transcriptional regulator [Eubacterium limosum]MCB6572108.1 helix-turn-helix domain-containing protein [Eubacterium limosum]